jgi:V8-like Glu-specific endopeptidase
MEETSRPFSGPRAGPAAAALAAVALLFTGASAQTGADGLPHTRGLPAGVTLLPAAEQPAWNAVGRVNVAGFRMARMCTGTLVAPDRVLTAAHCTLAANGRPARPDRLIFVAGWRVGNAAASGTALRVTRHEAYRPGREALRNPAVDLAILHLAEPLPGIRPIPLGVASETRTPLTILGYRGDRPHILHRYAPCPVTALRDDALRVACRAAPGTSGAPVLAETPRGPRLVAVVSSTGPAGSLAARPEAWAAFSR